jgi:hypothetical protein
VRGWGWGLIAVDDHPDEVRDTAEEEENEVKFSCLRFAPEGGVETEERKGAVVVRSRERGEELRAGSGVGGWGGEGRR